MPDVLRAYTIGPAQAAGTADWQGRLAPGCVADFVVWDQDPLETAGAALLQLGLRATFVAGQRVHHAD
jgi:predicted amidohydrolase YtcJ